MDKKPSILFVINTMGHAGAETAFITMLRNINPEEYDIDLYVLIGQGELFDRLPPYVNVINRQHTSHSVLTGWGRIGLFFRVLHRGLFHFAWLRWIPYAARNLREMRKAHRVQIDKLLWKWLADGSHRYKKEYDLAIAFLEGGATYYVGNYVKAKHKSAFVHVDYGLAGYTRTLDQGIYDRFDDIYAISDEVRKGFQRVYPEYKDKLSVFHNMIDQDYIRRMATCGRGFEDNYSGFRILTVGRLTPQKAYDVAIDAMAVLRMRGYRAKWYVLGEGQLREELEHRLTSYGLKEDFFLLGAKSNPYPFFQQCDIYVHATRFEGKSIAVQEAQTLGCPIIVSDVPGNREQIDHGVDGLICSLNPEAVADAIIELMNDKGERERFAAAACLKQFNSKDALEKILEVAKGETEK